jgi:hypothetical protein
MISIVSLVAGPTPLPRCLPIALLPGKKCCAKRRLTIATVAFSFTSSSEIATLQDRNLHRCEWTAREARRLLHSSFSWPPRAATRDGESDCEWSLLVYHENRD